jgi:hypothetical protein
MLKMDKRQAAESRAAGFVGLWSVSEKFSIREGRLISGGTERRMYAPGAPGVLSALVSELAAIHRRDRTVLDYAHQFGELGYRHLRHEDRKHGEPVAWIIAHSFTVDVAGELMVSMAEGDERVVAWWLDKALKKRFAAKAFVRQLFPAERWPKNPTQAAHEWLRTVINANIAGISRKVYEAPGGGSRSYFEFSAPVELVYWKLADDLEGGGHLRRCQECGHFFLSDDKRQRYCPRPIDVKISRCSSKHNVREYRARKGRK